MTKKKILVSIGLVAAAIGLIALGIAIARIITLNNPLPPSVSSKINFSSLVIPSGSPVQASDYAISTAEDGTRLLIYKISLDNRIISISQYPQPSEFNEVEQFKSKFLEDVIQQTSSVSSSGGTIYIGQMAKHENKPMAVMLERGLIVFMVPDQSLDEAQWRTIGDALTLVKPNN